MRRERLPALILVAGVAFGVLRVPHAVWGKRLQEIDAFRTQGDAAFHLRLIDRSGASARWLTWLRDHTPPDCVVPYRGWHEGALEFAAAVLFPRLLVDARALPPGATTYAARPLATGQLPGGGRSGVLMLDGKIRSLTVEVRE